MIVAELTPIAQTILISVQIAANTLIGITMKMKNSMEITKDNRVGNAVLRQMAKEYGFDINNVYLNDKYKYICTVDHNKKDADFCITEYKNKTYKVQYFSGCFNPFLISI